jgi:hypothetical protein
MKSVVAGIIVVVLLALSVALFLQNRDLRGTIQAEQEQPSFLTRYGDSYQDLRGIYTYPGIGALVLADSEGQPPPPASLTLAVFLSAETTCPVSLSEGEVFRRLTDRFRDRGQAVVAISSHRDSVAIAAQLADWKLDVPHVIGTDDTSMTFAQMGISPQFMPFKILYDSTMTAVYMRGADNTPASQAQFEQAALRLSDWCATGDLAGR